MDPLNPLSLSLDDPSPRIVTNDDLCLIRVISAVTHGASVDKALGTGDDKSIANIMLTAHCPVMIGRRSQFLDYTPVMPSLLPICHRARTHSQ